MENKIKVFENKNIRTVWNEEEEDWYFSVVDIIEILTGTERPRKYWNDLKKKFTIEGSELSEKIGQLKMAAADGKMRETDVLSTKNVLRLVQSIPSPKAEPFKMWLAQVGAERLDEIADPEKAIIRGADFYRAKGYTENWINQRLQTIEMRKELTYEWNKHGLKEGVQFNIEDKQLINIMILADKAERTALVQSWKRLEPLRTDPKIGALANLLSEGKPYALCHDALISSTHLHQNIAATINH